MTPQRMIEICRKTTVVIDRTIQWIEVGELRKALNELSGMYVTGIGGVMDELRKAGQMTCQHDYRFEVLNDGRQVQTRCWRCSHVPWMKSIDPDVTE